MDIEKFSFDLIKVKNICCKLNIKQKLINIKKILFLVLILYSISYPFVLYCFFNYVDNNNIVNFGVVEYFFITLVFIAFVLLKIIIFIFLYQCEKKENKIGVYLNTFFSKTERFFLKIKNFLEKLNTKYPKVYVIKYIKNMRIFFGGEEIFIFLIKTELFLTILYISKYVFFVEKNINDIIIKTPLGVILVYLSILTSLSILYVFNCLIKINLKKLKRVILLYLVLKKYNNKAEFIKYIKIINDVDINISKYRGNISFVNFIVTNIINEYDIINNYKIYKFKVNIKNDINIRWEYLEEIYKEGNFLNVYYNERDNEIVILSKKNRYDIGKNIKEYLENILLEQSNNSSGKVYINEDLISKIIKDINQIYKNIVREISLCNLINDKSNIKVRDKI